MEEESSSEKVENQSCRRLEFDVVLEDQLMEQGADHVKATNNVEHDQDGGSTVHSAISEELIPQVGMEFGDEQEAFDFYNRYAKEVGFSTRRSKGNRDTCGRWTSRLFVCSCEGARGKDKRYVKCPRPETRFGCQAELKLNINQVNGKLKVTKFVSKHSHVLASPRKRMFLRSQRNMSSIQKVEAELADNSGIAPKASIELMSKRVGGLENLGFIPNDYHNYLRKKRSEAVKIGDTGGLMEYLQKKQLDDPNFSYAIQVDIDDLITNIFWADGRMKSDYDYFGDVVCLDTTYKKHKDGRPLALFVGINHHRQTVIFGSALLYDETSATFKWLFDTFVQVMSGKKPKTILTDQDAAMASALVDRWPETHHRLCIWHMYQNAAKHLSHVFENFAGFAKDFQSCIYDFDEEEDFIIAWNKMLDNYDLRGNGWLKKQFEVKEKWALVYGRKTFCGNMASTQRSECMNNQIKNYINYNFDLLRFFEHFERLVSDRRYKELKADFQASQSKPFLRAKVEILEQARNLYTHAIFNDFSEQLWLAWDCEHHMVEVVEAVTTYKVFSSTKPLPHFVKFDSANVKVECSCNKFEFSGILCAHALKVLLLHNIKRLPDEYILKRWRSDAKVGSLCSNPTSSELPCPQANIGSRYKLLAKLYANLAMRGSLTDESFNVAVDSYNETLKNVEAALKGLSIVDKSGQHSSAKNKEVFVGGQCKIVKGIKLKTSSAGGSRRRKGALERATKKKRPRETSFQAQDQVMPNSNVRETRDGPSTILPTHNYQVDEHGFMDGNANGDNISFTQMLMGSYSLEGDVNSNSSMPSSNLHFDVSQASNSRTTCTTNIIQEEETTGQERHQLK